MIPEDEWAGWSPTWMLGHRITGKRLGIVGMGRIGQALARRAKAFGLSIHYHNRRRVPAAIEEELEATYWEWLDQMLARMDIVSVNCPHTPATYHLLSARRLKLMKPEAIIVNTARGEIIDETALARLIEAGELARRRARRVRARARRQPAPVKLARPGKVVLLPHMASATHRGPRRHGREGHRQHQDLHGRPPPAGPGAAVDAVRRPAPTALLGQRPDGLARPPARPPAQAPPTVPHCARDSASPANQMPLADGRLEAIADAAAPGGTTAQEPRASGSRRHP